MVASYSPMPGSVEMELAECAATREQFILQIRSLNTTASREYLSEFSLRALRFYYEHLEATSVPRGRMARWIRPAETPAIIGFVPDDE